MIAVFASVALRQYLVLQRVKVSCRVALVLAAAPPEQAAQDLLEGPPHVFVPERVDDGVDERVALGQHQAVLLVAQHLAPLAAQAVEQQHDQARRPADHEAACRGGEEGGGQGCRRSLEELK